MLWYLSVTSIKGSGSEGIRKLEGFANLTLVPEYPNSEGQFVPKGKLACPEDSAL